MDGLRVPLPPSSTVTVAPLGFLTDGETEQENKAAVWGEVGGWGVGGQTKEMTGNFGRSKEAHK